jgi:hypothetical protein
MSSDQRMHAVAARIEELVGYFAAASDPHVRHEVQELVTLLMELYGTALERILQLLQHDNAHAAPASEALLRDELIASLLVLHDLHPRVTIEALPDTASRTLVQLTRKPSPDRNDGMTIR